MPPRTELLRRINLVFEAHDLPTWEHHHLGALSSGECEIRDLLKVTTLAPHRVEMLFQLDTPDGASHKVAVRFGGTLYYVVPVLTLIEGDEETRGTRVCLVKRWRIELGQWTYQLPHGLEGTAERQDDAKHTSFETDKDDPMDIGIPTHSTSPQERVFSRAFGSQAFDALSRVQFTPLGRLLLKRESALAEAFIMTATVTRPFYTRQGDGAPILLAWENVLSLIDQGRSITDVNTIASLLKAARKLKVV